MKYYIHNLNKKTYFVVDSFDQMIDWFALHNRGRYHGLGFWEKKPEKINPKKFSYKDYNYALNHVAMNFNDTEWPGYYEKPVNGMLFPSEKVQREIMVIDEMDRIIDPRHYWDKIAVREVKRTSWKRVQQSYVYRYDPVPGVHKRKKRKGRSYYRGIKTTQERRLACDKEIKEFIRPSRNLRNLPNYYDEKPRNIDNSWKAKKVKKQWMKNIK